MECTEDLFKTHTPKPHLWRDPDWADLGRELTIYAFYEQLGLV